MTIHFKKILKNTCIQYFCDSLFNRQFKYNQFNSYYSKSAMCFDIVKYCFPQTSNNLLYITIPIFCTLGTFLDNGLSSIGDNSRLVCATVSSIVTGITSYMGAKYGHGMLTNDNCIITNDSHDELDNLYIKNIALIEDTQHTY